MREFQITQISIVSITVSYIFYALKDFQWEPVQDDLWSEKSFVFEKTKRNCGKFQVYGKDPAREMLNQFWFPEKSPVNSQQLENRDLVTVIIFTLVSNKKVI